MAAVVFLVFLFSMAGRSCANWCICKEGLSDAVLQKTLDYACGAGADCNPTHQNGPCFNPNTVRAHCNYAVNSYFQRNRQDPTACVFSGTASIITSDPSRAGCVYPATASASTTPISGTATGSSLPVLGGTNSGINDTSHGGIIIRNSILLLSCLILTFSGVLVF